MVATTVYEITSGEDVKSYGGARKEQSSFRYDCSSNTSINPRNRTRLPWIPTVTTLPPVTFSHYFFPPPPFQFPISVFLPARRFPLPLRFFCFYVLILI